jgi:hypothetical protein
MDVKRASAGLSLHIERSQDSGIADIAKDNLDVPEGTRGLSPRQEPAHPVSRQPVPIPDARPIQLATGKEISKLMEDLRPGAPGDKAGPGCARTPAENAALADRILRTPERQAPLIMVNGQYCELLHLHHSLIAIGIDGNNLAGRRAVEDAHFELRRLKGHPVKGNQMVYVFDLNKGMPGDLVLSHFGSLAPSAPKDVARPGYFQSPMTNALCAYTALVKRTPIQVKSHKAEVVALDASAVRLRVAVTDKSALAFFETKAPACQYKNAAQSHRDFVFDLNRSFLGDIVQVGHFPLLDPEDENLGYFPT